MANDTSFNPVIATQVGPTWQVGYWYFSRSRLNGESRFWSRLAIVLC